MDIPENDNENNVENNMFSSFLRPQPENFRNRIENILFLINRFNNVREYEEENNTNQYRRRMSDYPRNSYNFDLIDASLIPILKQKIVLFNDKKYSYYHLCKLNIAYKNKYNILLNIDFTAKKVILKTKYIVYINILDKEMICNNMDCEKNFCNGNLHLGSKKRKLLIKIEEEEIEKLMEKLEEKIQDYKYCIDCKSLWDIKIKERYVEEEKEKEDYDYCDNCVIQQSLDNKTLKIIETCSICLKKIYENKFTETLCKHLFHKNCLNTWLIGKNTCPLCRFQLKNNNTFHIIEEL
jgi:hypothetical protein